MNFNLNLNKNKVNNNEKVKEKDAGSLLKRTQKSQAKPDF